MAGPGVLYLDVDDEITSAAARIRRTDAARVAVVLPYGSRVATSRINFRLLARDALLHEKRLSIVAPDGATRALAASAGLPVFATVAEYETALSAEDHAADDTRRAVMPDDSPTLVMPVPGGAGGADDSTGAAADAPGTDPESDSPDTDAPNSRDGVAATGAAALAAASRDAPPAAAPTATPAYRQAPHPGRDPEPQAPQGRSIPVIGSSRGVVPRVPALVAAAVIGLVVLVSGVGAWLLLPSATIVVTPHERIVGPRTFSIVADTTATEPDPAAGIVPAEILTLDVEVSGTFPATGVRTEETRAAGRVTFTSYDTRGSNTIPGGSVIATEGGIRFRTLRAVTLPRADIVPPTSVSPTMASVDVEAVRQGPEGNVPENAITLVPAGEDPVITKVRNAEPTSGGSRTEFPIVAQADIDAALAALQGQLETAFQEELDDPAIAPPGATVFAETAVLGTAAPTTDPAQLVDAEQPTFDLGLTAEGTVVAVDPAPVEDIAQTRLESLVTPGNELVEGSVRIDPGAPVVEGQQVAFPVSVRATQVSIPDAAELEALVLGKSRADAEALLAPYGDVRLELWPDWVGSVPTIDGRVSVEVATPLPADTPEPTETVTPEPTESTQPSVSPPASASPAP